MCIQAFGSPTNDDGDSVARSLAEDVLTAPLSDAAYPHTLQQVAVEGYLEVGGECE